VLYRGYISAVKTELKKVGFEVLTAVSMKIAVFRVSPDDGGSKDL
jgi:hypothetical protein